MNEESFTVSTGYIIRHYDVEGRRVQKTTYCYSEEYIPVPEETLRKWNRKNWLWDVWVSVEEIPMIRYRHNGKTKFALPIETIDDEKETELLKQQALAKLSSEERKALGL